MSSELLVPTPFILAVLFDDPHAAPELTLHGPNSAADLALLSLFFDVRCNDVCLASHPPLSLGFLNPPDSLARTTTSTSQSLVAVLGMSGAGPEQLWYFHHAYIRGESRHLALEVALILRCFIVLVLRKLGPEASEDAVSGARNVWGRSTGRRRVKGREDEFRRWHLVDVLQECRLPWCWLWACS